MKTQCGKVLVAVVNNKQDMELLRSQYWYRIPVESVERWLQNCWVPEWIAFYQTKIFGDEAYAIHYYALINKIHKVYRWELFPNEPQSEKAQKLYYKLELSDLKRLSKPIVSDRPRRFSFISTTFERLETAVEMGDLFNKN